ncbi:PREDICTED: peptidyl-prolyl cis-trans isomerase FKBP62-like isoform X2 [Nelumbo nucifera]|nr:PREDICTED: peptidyl-prolyl cis-trans isomerase FKBP62-like isoform X2 [Nelumbo nucifera]
MLIDGTIVAKTPEEGTELHVKDGHFCPALEKAIKTMKRGEKVKLIVESKYAFGENGRDASNGFPAIPPNSVLNIDLVLLSFKPVIDVTGDTKVLKKILREGEGTVSANDGAAVTIRYTGKLQDGTIFERKGFDGVGPLEFVIDEEQVILGLDRAAATMKKGELCIVTINPEYGFGNNEIERDLAVIPPCSTVVYEVEMVDFTREKAPWEMSNHEKIETAGMKKEEGNALFKNGKFQRAAKRYEKATDYVSEDGTSEDGEQKLVKALRVSCWLNIAACNLKLNDFQGAIKLCSKVLDIEFYNVKALYRRAQAYIETADLDFAELDVKKALEVDPQNREFKSMQKKLKQLQVESNKRDAKLYTSMFAWMKKDTPVATKRLKVEKAEGEKMDEDAMAVEMQQNEGKTEDEKRDRDAMAMEMEKVAVSSAPPNNEMVVDSN